MLPAATTLAGFTLAATLAIFTNTGTLASGANRIHRSHTPVPAHTNTLPRKRKRVQMIFFAFSNLFVTQTRYLLSANLQKMLIHKNSAGTKHVPCATAKRKDRHIALQHLCTKHIRQEEKQKNIFRNFLAQFQNKLYLCTR